MAISKYFYRLKFVKCLLILLFFHTNNTFDILTSQLLVPVKASIETCVFFSRKKHKKHKNKKESENGKVKEIEKEKKNKGKLSVIVSEGGTKREVKGEVKKGSAVLANGSKKNNNIDSDGDIPTGPLEEEMNLDELMRQKVILYL